MLIRSYIRAAARRKYLLEQTGSPSIKPRRGEIEDFPPEAGRQIFDFDFRSQILKMDA
jgi:hypothetical protein